MSRPENGERVCSNVPSNAGVAARSSITRAASSAVMRRLPTESGTAKASSRMAGFRNSVFKTFGKCFAENRKLANNAFKCGGGFVLQSPAGEIATTLRAIPRFAASSAM